MFSSKTFLKFVEYFCIVLLSVTLLILNFLSILLQIVKWFDPNMVYDQCVLMRVNETTPKSLKLK